MFKRILLLLFSVIGCGMGIALTLKAGIGVAPYDAVSVGVSELLNMKTGDIVVLLNFLLVLSQLIMKGKDFKPIQFLQMIVSIVMGWSINLFLYNLFGNIEVTNYLLRLLLFLLGQCICAIFICISLELRVISFPLESTCMIISEKTKQSLGIVRQYADIVFVGISVIPTLAFKASLSLREGSIISLVVFGPLLDIVKPYIIKLLNSFNI